MQSSNNEKGRKTSKNTQNNTELPLSSAWIASQSLFTVFAGLWVLRENLGGHLDGSRLGKALQRLVSAEIAPGGPYAETNGVVDPLANATIALFLRGEGVRLPSLEPFLAQYEAVDLEKRMRTVATHDKAAAPGIVFRSLTDGNQLLLADIDARVRAAMTAWPSPLAPLGKEIFAALLRADKTGEIRLMPQLFASSLTVSPDMKSGEQLALLGAANVFFWIGGMLFDDFLDGEGKPELLPVATASHRQALALYRQVTAHNPAQYEQLEAYCLRADHANAWEVTHTRARVTGSIITLPELPDYDDLWALADRSTGHIFGPLLIMRQLPDVTDKQFVSIEQGLRHYLIARQLNDDICDWRKDLRAGQLSAVVVELLRGAHIRPGRHRLTTIMPKLERYFLVGGLQRTYGLLREHIDSARKLLAASGLFGAASSLEDLIAQQEAAMHRALNTHANYQKFLATFSDKR